jgi:hypothetical protein
LERRKFGRVDFIMKTAANYVPIPAVIGPGGTPITD